MEDWIPFLIIPAIIVIIIQVAFANRMQEIADMKEAPFRVWAWCFWLLPLGIAIVIALPDRRQSNKDSLTSALPWFCPQCGKQNEVITKKCDCGFEK